MKVLSRMSKVSQTETTVTFSKNMIINNLMTTLTWAVWTNMLKASSKRSKYLFQRIVRTRHSAQLVLTDNTLLISLKHKELSTPFYVFLDDKKWLMQRFCIAQTMDY